MGKSRLVALFLALYTQGMAKETGIHKPTLLLCPSLTVITQWTDMFEQFFPDFKIILAYGDRVNPKASISSRKRWLSPDVTAEGRKGRSRWAPDLRNIWEREKPGAERYVIFSTYDTWTPRTQKWDEKKVRENGKKKIFLISSSIWKDEIGLVIMNEGHRLKNGDTMTHIAAKDLEAQYNWLVTATPSITMSVSMPYWNSETKIPAKTRRFVLGKDRHHCSRC